MQQFELNTKSVFKGRNKIADTSKLSMDDALEKKVQGYTSRTLFNQTTQAGLSQSSFNTVQHPSVRYSKIDSKFVTQQKQPKKFQTTLHQNQQQYRTPAKDGLFRLESIQNLSFDQQHHLQTEEKERPTPQGYDKGSMTASFRNEITLPKVEKKKRVNRSTFVVKHDEAPSKRSSIFAETPKREDATTPSFVMPPSFLTQIPPSPARNLAPERQADESERISTKRRSTLTSLPPLSTTSKVPFSPVKAIKKGPIHFGSTVKTIDEGVFDLQRDMRTMERDTTQLRSDLEQIHFGITLKNKATTTLVMDSLMDLTKDLHRFMRDDEAQQKFVGAQMKAVQHGHQEIKREVVMLDQRGAACEAEIGTDNDIWYPAWYRPPQKDEALNKSPAAGSLKKLKRKQGSKENDEAIEISK